ncbi:MAG: Circoviridae 2 [Cyanobacteriota bacterium]|jgi:uncharacterized protein (DUF433 family)
MRINKNGKPTRKINVSRFFDEESGVSGRSDTGSGDGRGKHWVFTINNYAEDDIVRLKGDLGGADWVIFQGEISSTGTKHLQGAVSFGKPKRLSQVREICGSRGHYELRKGTADQAASYCRKSESYDPTVERYERGTRPSSQGSRSDLVRLADRVQAGANEAELFADFPGLYFRYGRGIREAIRICSKPRDFKSEVYWYWGPTGTGKSRRAFEEAPLAFWKSGIDNWWDGYMGQEVVIIDDYRTQMCPFNFLLRLFDRYPLLVPIKGGFVNFVAKKIYVTTPKLPKDTWSNRTDEDIKQLIRRIEVVLHFHNLSVN